MNYPLQQLSALYPLSAQLGGVLTHMELSSLFGLTNPVLLNRRINMFIGAGILQRYCRGVYTTKEFKPTMLAQKIRTDSYLSLESALAKYLMIGTVPQFKLSCLSTLPGAEFTGEPTISYGQISEEMCFGFDTLVDGTRIADREKALLDTLYFYLKGRKYFFNLFQDVDTSQVNRKKLNRYLNLYKNPKFKTFVRSYLDGKFSNY